MSTVEHHRIVDTVGAGDPDAAEAAMLAHLNGAPARHAAHVRGG